MKKIIKLFLNLVFGAVPSILFFIWIERNCSLPNFFVNQANALSWPWLQLDLSTPGQCTWNFTLILIFGAIHTFTAQAPFQRFLSRFAKSDFHRSIYLMITGMSVLGVMALWLNTGVIVWLVPGLSFFSLNLLSIALYLFFFAFTISVLLRFDGLSFVGLRQVLEESPSTSSPSSTTTTTPKASQLQPLQRDGFFRYLRHPIYFFTLLAILVTPFMTLDRLTVFVAVIVYLNGFGLRYEERKLVEVFGERYLVFQNEVPAIFPRFKS